MTPGQDLLAQAASSIDGSASHLDPDYPRFHLAPPVGRLNDPNGLVVIDGRYHACYQFSPFFPEQRLVFWGHASSTDLLHWTDHGPALAPDAWYDRTGVYSGGALVRGSSVWFYYTGNVRLDDGGREAFQCLATSDDLVHFSKSETNPLIPAQPAGYTAHFRDPQVWREGDRYRMCLGAQRADETGCALLFTSPDGLAWEFEGELTLPDTEVGPGRVYMWECPNLVRLVDADTGEPHDVLLFCPQGIALDDGLSHNEFPCGYVVGNLVGTDLRDTGGFRELDRGFEFYAPQVFTRAPDDQGPAVLMAWAGNPGQDDQPSLEGHRWVHTMALPRELSLHSGLLRQRPVLPELGQVFAIEPSAALQPLEPLAGARGFILELLFPDGWPAGFALRLGTADAALHLGLGPEGLVVDRSATAYPAGGRRSTPLPPGCAPRLVIAHDRSITEIFAGDGELSFTLRNYLGAGPIRIDLAAASGATARLVNTI